MWRVKQAKQEIKRLSGALNILSKPFSGHDTLTRKERIALARIIRGASSKEAARTLGISPRTVDFHRANLLKKLGARNAGDLVSSKQIAFSRLPMTWPCMGYVAKTGRTSFLMGVNAGDMTPALDTTQRLIEPSCGSKS